jgi:hypothetical protein
VVVGSLTPYTQGLGDDGAPRGTSLDGPDVTYHSAVETNLKWQRDER